MKKFALQTIVILVLGFIAHRFLPFWATALIAGLVGLLFNYENSAVSFAAGFLAASILWGGYAGFLNSANLFSLSGMLGALFKLEGPYLVYVTAIVGGLLGGFAAMTGTLARKLFEKNDQVAV